MNAGMRLRAHVVLALALLFATPLPATTVEYCEDKATDIPDADATAGVAGLLETVFDVEDSLNIDSVSVSLDITHAFIGDLAIDLVSPSETLVILYFDTDPFGAPDDTEDMLVEFTDDGVDFGSDDWTCDCAMQPFGAFSDYFAEESEGEWTLSIFDVIEDFTGTLNEACLVIDGCAIEAASAIFCDLSDDEADVTVSWKNPVEGDAINLYRNAELLETLDGDATEYTDEGADPGVHTYSIAVVDDEEECETRGGSCTVTVGLFETCVELDSDNDIVSEADPVVFSLEVEDELEVYGLEVKVEIAHTWIGDLIVDITNPDAVTTTVIEDIGLVDPPGLAVLADDDLVDVAFNDDGVEFGSTVMDCTCRMQPQGPGTMADLVGKSAVGEWSLTVEDPVPMDDGTLDSWCLGVFGVAAEKKKKEPEVVFLRGDANGNGAWNNLADPLFLLKAGFEGGAEQPPCEEAADIDGNGEVQFIPDSLYGLFHAFGDEEPAPPAPWPDCDSVPVSELEIGCETEPECP